MTIAEAIARGRDALLAAGVPPDEAPGDAEVLARHVLGWDLARLVASRRDATPAAFQERFDGLIARRARREPVSQITGHREFWGLDFEVTRDVLTPRPETETLVEAVVEAFPREAPIVIMDVGTGSGCLAVALAREFQHARLIASDISLPALDVARRNATAHGVIDRIAFVHSAHLENDVDLIVSNPPYIAERDAGSLPPEVREYEPHIALFGGSDGLDFYRRLFSRASGEHHGKIAVEVGYDQAQPVSAIAQREGWTCESIRKDLQGIPRALLFHKA